MRSVSPQRSCRACRKKLRGAGGKVGCAPPERGGRRRERRARIHRLDLVGAGHGVLWDGDVAAVVQALVDVLHILPHGRRIGAVALEGGDLEGRLAHPSLERVHDALSLPPMVRLPLRAIQLLVSATLRDEGGRGRVSRKGRTRRGRGRARGARGGRGGRRAGGRRAMAAPAVADAARGTAELSVASRKTRNCEHAFFGSREIPLAHAASFYPPHQYQPSSSLPRHSAQTTTPLCKSGLQRLCLPPRPRLRTLRPVLRLAPSPFHPLLPLLGFQWVS